MKNFAIALLVLISLFGPSIEDPFSNGKVLNTCFELLRIVPDLRERFRRGGNIDRQDGPTSCIIRCNYIVSGIYEDDKGFNTDPMAELSRDFVVKDVGRKYRKCAAKIKPEEYGDDYCKKGMRHFLCMYDAFWADRYS